MLAAISKASILQDPPPLLPRQLPLRHFFSGRRQSSMMDLGLLLRVLLWKGPSSLAVLQGPAAASAAAPSSCVVGTPSDRYA